MIISSTLFLLLSLFISLFSLTPVSLQIDSIKWYKDGREFYRLHPEAASGYIRQFEVSSTNYIPLN